MVAGGYPVDAGESESSASASRLNAKDSGEPAAGGGEAQPVRCMDTAENQACSLLL